MTLAVRPSAPPCSCKSFSVRHRHWCASEEVPRRALSAECGIRVQQTESGWEGSDGRWTVCVIGVGHTNLVSRIFSITSNPMRNQPTTERASTAKTTRLRPALLRPGASSSKTNPIVLDHNEAKRLPLGEHNLLVSLSSSTCACRSSNSVTVTRQRGRLLLRRRRSTKHGAA